MGVPDLSRTLANFDPVGSYQRARLNKLKIQEAKADRDQRQRTLSARESFSRDPDADLFDISRRLAGAGDIQGAGVYASLARQQFSRDHADRLFDRPPERVRLLESLGMNLGTPDGKAAARNLLFPQKDNRTALVRNYQTAVDGGFDGSLVDYQKATRSGGDTINVGSGETTFQKEIGKDQANLFTGMFAEGKTARQQLSDISQMRKLLRGKTGGLASGLQSFAAKHGIAIGSGASDIQAFQAIISRIAPTLREPGSGETSNRDLEVFLQSLPAIINTPKGNDLILDTLQNLAFFKAQQASVASQVLGGEMSRVDGIKKLQSLFDPFAKFKKARRSMGYIPPAGQNLDFQFSGAPGVATPGNGSNIVPGTKSQDRVGRGRLLSPGRNAAPVAEGTIIRNPTTGERAIRQNGQWVPIR